MLLLALLDISAAFDTVDHGILLQRLHTSHHINGLALDWFWIYLTGRRERVLYGGDTTLAALVEYVVLQGLVLGPLLFVLYTSDVPRVINECGLLSVVYATTRRSTSKLNSVTFQLLKFRSRTA